MFITHGDDDGPGKYDEFDGDDDGPDDGKDDDDGGGGTEYNDHDSSIKRRNEHLKEKK